MKQIEMSLEQAKKLVGTLGEDFDKVLFTNFPELNKVDSWEKLGKINGWYVSSGSEVNEYQDFTVENKASTRPSNKNIYAFENQARSALAEAQLSQLMLNAWGDWRPNWKGNVEHVCICPYENRHLIQQFHMRCYFLVFPTYEMAQDFYESHKELISEYFLKYQY